MIDERKLIQTKDFLQRIIGNSANRQPQDNNAINNSRSTNTFVSHDSLEGSSRDFSLGNIKRGLSFQSDVSFASSEGSLTRNFRSMFNISSNNLSNENDKSNYLYINVKLV